jgi:hypothetical protein
MQAVSPSPEAHEEAGRPRSSKHVGGLNKSQSGAVTLVGTGYSPHEGVPGRSLGAGRRVSGASGRAIRARPAAVRCNRQDESKPDRLAADTECRLLKLPIAPFILAKWFGLVSRASSTKRWDEGGWAIAGSWKMPEGFRRKRGKAQPAPCLSRGNWYGDTVLVFWGSGAGREMANLSRWMGKLKSAHGGAGVQRRVFHCQLGTLGTTLDTPDLARVGGKPLSRPPRAKTCLPPNRTSMGCNLSVTSDSKICRAPAFQRQRLFGRSRHD